jgi:hypothetical protein
MSTWNTKLILKFRQRLPCWFDATFFGRRYAEPNGFNRLEPIRGRRWYLA